eukprot:1125041_1
MTYDSDNICSGITRALWHDVFVYCLTGMVLLTAINILIMDYINYPDHMEIVIIIISLVLEWGCILILCKMLFKYLYLADLKPVLCLYVITIIAFADIYLLAYRVNPSSFSLPNHNTILTMTFIDYSVSCQTLTGISSVSPKSVSAEFLTAMQLLLAISYSIFILSIAVLRFCEPEEQMSASISRCPRISHLPSPNTLTNTLKRRLSCIPNEGYDARRSRKLFNMSTKTDSIMYTPLKSGKTSSYECARPRRTGTTVVSSWEVNESDNNRLPLTKSSATGEDEMEYFQFPTECPVVRSEDNNDLNDSVSTATPVSELTELTASQPGSFINCISIPKSWSLSFSPDLNASTWQIYERNRRMGRGCVKWIYKHMTLMLLGTEIPRLVAMYFACNDLRCDSNNVLLIVGIALDSLLLILSLFGVLMKMSLIHTLPQAVKVNITIRSLIRVFLTLVVLFGILQFDIWVITKDTTHPAFAVDVATVDIERYWLMVWHFMFLSVATFTNAGVGDNISELSELGQSVNNLQMLVALLFNVVVFGVGLLRLGEEREKAMEKFVDQEILQIRKKRSEKKNAISYLSIGKSAPALETIQEIVRKKSNVLRKQGLLPGVVTPLFTLARKHTMAKQNKRYESCYHSL